MQPRLEKCGHQECGDESSGPVALHQRPGSGVETTDGNPPNGAPELTERLYNNKWVTLRNSSPVGVRVRDPNLNPNCQNISYR